MDDPVLNERESIFRIVTIDRPAHGRELDELGARAYDAEPRRLRFALKTFGEIHAVAALQSYVGLPASSSSIVR